MKYIIYLHGIKVKYDGYVSSRLIPCTYFKKAIRNILFYHNDSLVNRDIVNAKRFKSLKSAEKRMKHLKKIHKGDFEFEILEVEE